MVNDGYSEWFFFGGGVLTEFTIDGGVGVCR